MLLLSEKKLLLVKVRDHRTAHNLTVPIIRPGIHGTVNTVMIPIESKDIKAALLAIELKKDYKTKENGIFHAVQNVSFLVKFSIQTLNNLTVTHLYYIGYICGIYRVLILN